MSEDIDDLVEELEDQQYTLVGEVHDDPYVGEQVVEPLLESGDYDNLYLEAVLRGNYTEQGDELLTEGENKIYDFYGTEEKYDQIIETAEKEGVEIHGIDNHGDSRKEWSEEISDWADYILETSSDSNLVVVGEGHMLSGNDEKDKDLSKRLEREVDEDQIASIMGPSRYHEREDGVYTAEELDEIDGDLIYLNPNSNNSQTYKVRSALKRFGMNVA